MKQLSYTETEIYLIQRGWINRYVGISTLFSFFLLSSIFVVQYFFSSNQIKTLPVIQVDIVALPNFKKNNISINDIGKQPIAKNIPKVKSSNKDNSMVFKKKKALESINKIKEKIRKRNLKEISKQRAKEQEILKKFQEKYRSILAANQTNKGDSISGALEASINKYVTNIVNQIRENWELPLYLQDKGLRAGVVLHIDRNGNARYTFSKRSGNDIFDELVRNALELSIPFLQPPPEIISLLKNEGIEVLFPL